MRYRFKGIVRSTGQTVEGHAHGQVPDEALAALSEHGIVTESLREDPEPLNLDTQSQPFSSAIDSALDTAASQVPFDAVAKQYKGKNVWVLDRDKIRKRVAQVVDQAIQNTLGGAATGGSGVDVEDVRKQVADAIGGLFKDNRNLTSQVSNASVQMEGQVRRIEAMVHRAESVLAQMTIAISRMGSGGYGGGGGGPRRLATAGGGGGSAQNSVLLEIFKENLRLRGIEIDEPKPAGADDSAPPVDGSSSSSAMDSSQGDSSPMESSASSGTSSPMMSEPPIGDSSPRIQRPASPLSAEASSPGQFNSTNEVELEPNERGET